MFRWIFVVSLLVGLRAEDVKSTAPLSTLLTDLLDESRTTLTSNPMVMLTVDTVVDEPIIFQDCSRHISGVGGYTVGHSHTQQTSSMFSITNATIHLTDLTVNKPAFGPIAKVELDGELELAHVQVKGGLSEKSMFFVDGGRVHLNNITVPAMILMSSLIDDLHLNSQLQVRDTTFDSQVLCGDRGLLYASKSAISDCVFSNVTAAVHFDYSSMAKQRPETCEVQRSLFDGCENVLSNLILTTVVSHGFTSTNNTYHRTTTTYTSRQYITASNQNFYSDNFLRCSSSSNGGAIYFAGSYDLSLSYCTFNSCHTSSFGGAVYFSGSYVNSSIFNSSYTNYTYCESSDYGGAIHHYYGTLRITGGRITNTRTSRSNGYGGGIYINSTGSSTTLYELYLGNCTAYLGGGIYISSSVAAINISTTTIEDCNASSGGAIYVTSLSDPLYLRYIAFDHNRAFNYGEDLYSSSSYATSSYVTGCYTSTTASVYVSGYSYSWFTYTSSPRSHTGCSSYHSYLYDDPATILSGGVIAGIVVAAVVVCAIPLLICCCFCCGCCCFAKSAVSSGSSTIGSTPNQSTHLTGSEGANVVIVQQPGIYAQTGTVPYGSPNVSQSGMPQYGAQLSYMPPANYSATPGFAPNPGMYGQPALYQSPTGFVPQQVGYQPQQMGYPDQQAQMMGGSQLGYAAPPGQGYPNQPAMYGATQMSDPK